MVEEIFLKRKTQTFSTYFRTNGKYKRYLRPSLRPPFQFQGIPFLITVLFLFVYVTRSFVDANPTILRGTRGELNATYSNGDQVTHWGAFANTVDSSKWRQPTYRLSEAYSPDGGGYLVFDRDNKTYFWTGTEDINIKSNGGFTSFTLIKFTGDSGDSEAIFEYSCGFNCSDISFRRYSTTNRISFSINNAYGSTDSTFLEIVSDEDAITQEEWAVFGVRYSDETGQVELWKDGKIIKNDTWGTGVADRTLSKTYVGRGYVGDNINAQMGALYISDQYLSDEKMDFSFIEESWTYNVVELSEQYLFDNYNDGDSVSNSGDGFVQSNTNYQPIYYSSGGYQNLGYLNFSDGSYMDGGKRTLNIGSNAGLTVIFLALVPEVVNYGKWIDMRMNGDNIFRIQRSSGSTKVQFRFDQYAGTNAQKRLECELGVSTDEWATIAFRFNAINGLAEAYVNGVFTCSEYLPTGKTTGVKDIKVDETRFPRGQAANIGGFYIVDKWMTDLEMKQHTEAMIFNNRSTIQKTEWEIIRNDYRPIEYNLLFPEIKDYLRSNYGIETYSIVENITNFEVSIAAIESNSSSHGKWIASYFGDHETEGKPQMVAIRVFNIASQLNESNPCANFYFFDSSPVFDDYEGVKSGTYKEAKIANNPLGMTHQICQNDFNFGQGEAVEAWIDIYNLNQETFEEKQNIQQVYAVVTSSETNYDVTITVSYDVLWFYERNNNYIWDGSITECFGANENITYRLGEENFQKPMKEVNIGDEALAMDTHGKIIFAPITKIPHEANSIETEFFILTVSHHYDKKLNKDAHSIRLTSGHLLPSSSNKLCSNPQYLNTTSYSLRMASEIQVGDCLLVVQEEKGENGIKSLPAVVSNIRKEMGIGIYSAATDASYIIVNGIVASPYAFNEEKTSYVSKVIKNRKQPLKIQP